MKKTLAFTLALSMTVMNFIPLEAHAINDVSTTEKTKRSLFSKKVKTPDTPKYEYVNMNWWSEYNDPYLTSYINKALENNQDIKIATLRVEEARQNVKSQFANELPSLSAGVSPALFKMPGVTNTEGAFSIPIMASYEADIFLKNHDKTKSKKKLHEISKFNEKAVYLSVASAVGSTYYNIVGLDKQISLQENIVKDRKQIFELMKQRNEIGITSTSDLTKAEKGFILAQSDLIELKKSREVLLNSLAVLTGETPNNISEFKRISYDKLVASKKIPSEISSDIIDNRPDYLAAEKMVEKAGIDVRAAKKEFLPTINILGLLSFTSTSMVNSMSWETSLAALAASAMVPFYTGGRNMANLRLKKNMYEQVLQQYYKTNLTAIQEVNDALTSVKLDNEKFQKNTKALNMEKKDFSFTQAKYNAGTISYLDLLQQKETMLSTEKMVASSKINYYVSQISLYKAVAANDL